MNQRSDTNRRPKKSELGSQWMRIPEKWAFLSRTVMVAGAVFMCLFAIGARSEEPVCLVVHFFGSATCGECREIRSDILAPLKQKYPDKLDVLIHDIDDEQDFQLLVAMEESYRIEKSMPIQLFLPDTFLSGGSAVKMHASALIEQYVQQPDKWQYNYRFDGQKGNEYSSMIRERFQQFTFLGILAAGLIDGINPCAIATMIFLISFLATRKRKRSEILVIGLCFTASVFVTYLLLGLGAFKALTLLESYGWLSKAIRWSAVVLAGGLGVVSFYDAAAYALSRKASAVKLQLPRAVKLRIHKVVSANLSGSSLITGAIITGFLVTLLEAVCTGQVYLPTIILMTRQGGLRLQGWLYLLFYNFLFVLPLLVVMVFAYRGLTWNKLSGVTQKYLPVMKVLLGAVLIGLAIFLASAM